MKKQTLLFTLFLSGIIFLSACSKDDVQLDTKQTDGFVLAVITDVSNSSGILIPYDSLPSSTVDPGSVSGFSYADVRSSGYSYGNSIFENTNSAGDPGVQKITLTPDGELMEDGFIVGGVISAVKNDDLGYYWDPDMNAKAIQTFNPTSMERTGQIDLSTQLDPYITDSVKSISFNWFMELAADKLYTMVTFEDANAVPVHDSSLVVVINTITNEFEAMAIHPEFFMFGYYGQPNIEYTSVGNDGNLYLAAWGGQNFNIKGTILRIPTGETEFDRTFEIKLDDFVGGPAMMYGGSCYYDGKLYVRLKESAVKPDFSNWNTVPDIYPYEIDIATGEVTKIEGTPGSNHNSIHGPFLYEDKIYFPASNPDYQGYYKYDPASGGTAEEIFTLSSGVPAQIYILSE